MHMDCMSSYFASLIDSSGRGTQFKGERVIDLEHFEFLCPLCGRLTNSLCPILPSPADQPEDELGSALDDIDVDADMEVQSPVETLDLIIDSVDPTQSGKVKTFKEIRLPDSSCGSEYSFVDALENFALRFSCVLHDWNVISFDTDLFSQLCSMLPYNIGIMEVEQRTLAMNEKVVLGTTAPTTVSDSEMPRIGMISMPQTRMAEMRVLLRVLFHYKRWAIDKDTRRNPIAGDPMEEEEDTHAHSSLEKHVRLLVNVLSQHDFSSLHNRVNEHTMEKEEGENEVPENVFPPLLSCDLFTLLVYLTILRPEIVLRPRAFRSLLCDLYFAAVFQAFMVWMQWFQAKFQDPVAYPSCTISTWLHERASNIVKSMWEFRVESIWWILALLNNNEDAKLREAFPSLPSVDLVRRVQDKPPASSSAEDSGSSTLNETFVRSLFELLATSSSFTGQLSPAASSGASTIPDSEMQSVSAPTESSASSSNSRWVPPHNISRGTQDMEVIDEMDDRTSTENGGTDADSENLWTSFVKGLCLVFLRRAALFEAIVFGTELPNCASSTAMTFTEQFDLLTRHLGLPSLEELAQPQQQGQISHPVNRARTLTKSWADQFLRAIRDPKDGKLTFNALTTQLPLCLFPKFGLPLPFHLIPLPPVYQKLYQQHYHSKCDQCGRQIKYPVLCLVTGKIAWLGLCECNPDGNGKCNQHRREFTGGNGLFIVIAASSVLLMRGTRHTFLMSPYLDQHGEQDWGLRRGKPLYLDRSRVQFLASRFLTNSWDQDTQILMNTQTRDTDSY